MKRILLFSCLFIISGILYAQSGRISGKISDADTHEPLHEVSVIIKGPSQGINADINGQFTLGNLFQGS